MITIAGCNTIHAKKALIRRKTVLCEILILPLCPRHWGGLPLGFAGRYQGVTMPERSRNTCLSNSGSKALRVRDGSPGPTSLVGTSSGLVETPRRTKTAHTLENRLERPKSMWLKSSGSGNIHAGARGPSRARDPVPEPSRVTGSRPTDSNRRVLFRPHLSCRSPRLQQMRKNTDGRATDFLQI